MTAKADALDTCVPRLPRGCRLQYEAVQDCWVVLYPEGMVKLSGSGAEILKRVDGRRSVADMVSDLQRAFPGADLRADVHDFLREAARRGWLALQ
jgi:pyrroloquinoline quinone biosynthesis protein D